MAETGPHAASYTATPPVRWEPGRDNRGGAASQQPKCPVRGCPVKYTAGDDRLCALHRAEDEAGVTDRERALSRASTVTGRRWRAVGETGC